MRADTVPVQADLPAEYAIAGAEPLPDEVESCQRLIRQLMRENNALQKEVGRLRPLADRAKKYS